MHLRNGFEVIFANHLSCFLIKLLVEVLVVHSSFVDHFLERSFVDSFVGHVVQLSYYFIRNLWKVLDASQFLDHITWACSAFGDLCHQLLLEDSILDFHALHHFGFQRAIYLFQTFESCLPVHLLRIRLYLLDHLKCLAINELNFSLLPQKYGNVKHLHDAWFSWDMLVFGDIKLNLKITFYEVFLLHNHRAMVSERSPFFIFILIFILFAWSFNFWAFRLILWINRLPEIRAGLLIEFIQDLAVLSWSKALIRETHFHFSWSTHCHSQVICECFLYWVCIFRISFVNVYEIS